jgi:metallophosphoesterase superfamily enzyme
LKTSLKSLSNKNPSHLVIAADLVQAKDGMSTHVLDIFREWIESIRIPIILTEGNHDRMLDFLNALSLSKPSLISKSTASASPTIPTKSLPTNLASPTTSTRHPHLESPRRSLRTPFFHLRHPHYFVLPAFSRFTGLNIMKPEK